MKIREKQRFLSVKTVYTNREALSYPAQFWKLFEQLSFCLLQVSTRFCAGLDFACESPWV